MNSRAPIFAVLASLALAVGWWFLLYQPKGVEREEIEAETAELERETSRLRTEIAELSRVRDNEMEIRADLAKHEEFIPEGVAQPLALREFQQAADTAGVNIRTVAFGEPVAVQDGPPTGDPGTTLAQIQITMTVDGGYFQTVDLLRRFETSVPRALLVETLAMSEGGDGFPTLATNWSGRMFAVVDVASTVAPEDGAPVEPGAEDVDEDDMDDPADDEPEDVDDNADGADEPIDLEQDGEVS